MLLHALQSASVILYAHPELTCCMQRAEVKESFPDKAVATVEEARVRLMALVINHLHLVHEGVWLKGRGHTTGPNNTAQTCMHSMIRHLP